MLNNDTAGYLIKKIKQDDVVDDKYKAYNEVEKQTEKFTDDDVRDSSNQHQEKKLFSFLKWFKKTKEYSYLKNKKNFSPTRLSAIASRKSLSTESVDTLFGTETVRSFAYIPPMQYQPSAPTSSLLDLNEEKNIFVENFSDEISKEVEFQRKKKKKRKAPDPPSSLHPSIMRENSLPSALKEKSDKTMHRRTVSESSKDKKAGAYRHVKGKKKAPLPPPKVYLYPDLQKLNSNYESFKKKKKPAPSPPSPSKCNNGNDKDGAANSNNLVNKSDKNGFKEQEFFKTQEIVKGMSEKNEAKTNLEENFRKKNLNAEKTPPSPFLSKPWYKRSYKDPSIKKLNEKDFNKGSEKKKNKEFEDLMPEVGFSRCILPGGVSNMFMLPSKTEKLEDKKKEEKRKSQISILTNISELDKEAAEIVRKEQAEERKLMAENDAKYYLPSNSPIYTSRFDKINDEHKKLKKITEKSKLNDSNVIFASGKNNQNNCKIEFESENNFPKSNADSKSKSQKINCNLSSEPIKEEGTLATYSTNTNISKKNNSEVHSKGDLNYNMVPHFNDPWVCGKCTLENPGWRVFCEICNSVKPHFLYNSKSKFSKLNKDEISQIGDSKRLVGKDEKNENDALKQPKMDRKNVKINKQQPTLFASESLNSNEANVSAESKNVQQSFEDLEKTNLKNKEINQLRKSDFALVNKIINVGAEDESQHLSKAPKEGNQNVENEVSVSKLEIIEQNSNTKTPKNCLTNQIMSSSGLNNINENRVIEAYVITQTTVLEDVIIRKSEKADASKMEVKDHKVQKPTRMQKKDIQSIKGSKEKKNSAEVMPTREKLSKDLDELTSKLARGEGLEDFLANIRAMTYHETTNTASVNELLTQLETAINEGNQLEAGKLAKKLALLDINRRVTGEEAKALKDLCKITIDVIVEDKECQKGPIKIQVSPSMTLLQLKEKAHQEFGIPVDVQRWILGKTLATDDHRTLESDGIDHSRPVFLYLVSSDKPTNFVVENKALKLSSQINQNFYFDDLGRGGHHQEGEENDDDSPNKHNTNDNIRKYDENFHESKEKDDKNHGKDVNLNENKTSSEKQKSFVFNEIKENENKNENENENENDLKKELNLIPAKSVKQKVAKLNKAFEENSKKENDFKILSNRKLSNLKYSNNFLDFNAENEYLKQDLNINGMQKKISESDAAKESSTATNYHYDELIKLQEADVVINLESFNCPICLVGCSPGEGITLKDCLHTFCRPCLINTVKYNENAEVKCPYFDNAYSCTSVLQQREIKALVPQNVFDQHLANSVKEAENKMENAFHCKTPDCKGWCIYEDNVNQFHCPVCNMYNCLTCQAIHTGMNCKEYQEKVREEANTDTNAKKTKIMLNEMVNKGEAMVCPKCQVVLMKKWGCDWLRCSMCKTEICWVTRGFRWGPAGKGDTSGGCKCGINGIKCHPKCNYCH